MSVSKQPPYVTQYICFLAILKMSFKSLEAVTIVTFHEAMTLRILLLHHVTGLHVRGDKICAHTMLKHATHKKTGAVKMKKILKS